LVKSDIMGLYSLFIERRNKFVEKRELGLVRYLKPKKNIYTKEQKAEQVNRRLCTSAYRK